MAQSTVRLPLPNWVSVKHPNGLKMLEKLQLKRKWLAEFSDQSKAPGNQSQVPVGRILPALSSACKRIASISGVQPFLPNYIMLQAAT